MKRKIVWVPLSIIAGIMAMVTLAATNGQELLNAADRFLKLSDSSKYSTPKRLHDSIAAHKVYFRDSSFSGTGAFLNPYTVKYADSARVAGNSSGGSAGIPFGTASGTNTYAVTTVPVTTSYTAGQVINVLFTNANTSSTVSINVNGNGAQTVQRMTGKTLLSGDIAAGQVVTLVYDGAEFNMINSPFNALVVTGSGTPQTVALNINGPASTFQNLTVSSLLNIPSSSGYMQFNGSPPTYIQWDNSTGTAGLSFQVSGNPYYLAGAGGKFLRNVGGVIYNAPWDIAQSKTAQTTTQPIYQLPPDYTGMYEVKPFVKVSSVSGGTVTVSVSYTDENGTSQTDTFYPQGSTTAALSTTGTGRFPPMVIYAQTGHNVTVTVTVTGTITYDGYATVTQL